MLATILLIEVLSETRKDRTKQISRVDSGPIYAFLHQEITRFRGSEISWINRCYTATFDGPTRAIHCAKAILKSANRLDTAIRAGLHTGECQFKAGNLIGVAVQIAKGALTKAEPNEILTSSTVKDLVVGSGFRFVEREQCLVDGVSGKWGMFSIV
jgi:class 3 adenylate cyclase